MVPKVRHYEYHVQVVRRSARLSTTQALLSSSSPPPISSPTVHTTPPRPPPRVSEKDMAVVRGMTMREVLRLIERLQDKNTAKEWMRESSCDGDSRPESDEREMQGDN